MDSRETWKLYSEQDSEDADVHVRSHTVDIKKKKKKSLHTLFKWQGFVIYNIKPR